MAKSLIKPVKGMRDFYPEQWAFQKWLSNKWLELGSLFGYQEYEGPIVEQMDLYLEKTSEEIVSGQTFTLLDRDGNKLVLRPELTPTFARMVAQKENELTPPIRWQSFGPFFRYEKPQRGRGRSFFQWNIDCIGSDSILTDAEILTIACLSLKKLGLSSTEATIKINDRAAMQDYFCNQFNIQSELISPLFRIVDRIDKLPEEVFIENLKGIGLSQLQINNILSFLEEKDPSFSPWLKELFKMLEMNGVSEYCELDLKIIRGFDYYTRTVFEAWAKTTLKRALFGGGRYDNLTQQVGGKKRLPGIGFAIGDMAVYELLLELNKLPTLPLTQTKALITLFSPELQTASLKLASDLRSLEIPVEIYPDDNKGLDKQIKYADQKGIPNVIIIGPDEVKNNQCVLKNLKEHVQITVGYTELVGKLKEV